jgi:hypothetical protein
MPQYAHVQRGRHMRGADQVEVRRQIRHKWALGYSLNRSGMGSCSWSSAVLHGRFAAGRSRLGGWPQPLACGAGRGFLPASRSWKRTGSCPAAGSSTRPPAPGMTAGRAGEPARPAQPLQVVQAVPIGAEPGLELPRRRGVVNSSAGLIHARILLRLSEYPRAGICRCRAGTYIHPG